MKTLDQIGIEFQTDKASQFSRTYAPPHDYLRHLAAVFDPLRRKPVKLLEIGIGGGESARTWLDFFSEGKVFGVDLVQNTNPYNTPGSTEIERYTFCQGNQSEPIFWKCFLATYGNDWDIIIDDGSHVSADILVTFASLWPSLNSGGIYEIEDLAVAPEAKDWLISMAAPVMGGAADIDSIYFSKELAIIRKR